MIMSVAFCPLFMAAYTARVALMYVEAGWWYAAQTYHNKTGATK